MMANSYIRKLRCCGLFIILAFLLSACGFPGMVSTSAHLPVVSQTQTVPRFPPIRFPQDEGTHNNLTEWWYYTGHLDTTDKNHQTRHYGFELVIFQVLRSDLPPVYAAHFAMSDITRGSFSYDQHRLTMPASTLPSDATNGLNVRVGNWSIQGLNGRDHLTASMQNYAVDLKLLGLKLATLHNGNGLITYGIGGFSYYYSRTRMAVSGTIMDHQQLLNVTGLGWMDHQWGNFLLLNEGGWNWYSLQLNDGTEIMLYFVRDAMGRVVSTYGGYIDAEGRNHLLSSQAIKEKVLGTWKSPATGIIYPSGWLLNITDPQLKASLTIIPQLKNQELVVLQSTGNTYWEGAVSIQGQKDAHSVGGSGYVELTGYHK